MRILLTGGGSGGHILPNVALLRLLAQKGVETVYMGEKNGMEETLIAKEGIPFYGIYAGKMRRYFSIQNIIDWFKIPVGIVQAWKYLGMIQPDKIFSKGGYVAVPVVIAARLRNIPVIIHESDVHPGLTTKISSKFAKEICVSWSKTVEYFKGKSNVHLTGVPIRTEFLHGNAAKGKEIAGFTNDKSVLLVVGGGLGASALNEFIFSNKTELLKTHNIIHIAGIGKIPASQKNEGGYAIFELCGDEYIDLLASADIVLSRAGSTALSEFAAAGKKLILVPLPTSSSRGDQLENAEVYIKDHPGSAILLRQEDITLDKVQQYIQELGLNTVETKSSSGETAAEKIVGLLLG